MKKDIHILMLEDDAADAELTRFALRKGGLRFSIARVETKEEYLQELSDRPPELILSDYSLPGFNGQDALDIAREQCPETPFIFVTGTMGEEVAIETLKSGATDYVLKTRLSRLMPAVNRALREAQERTEHRRAEEQLRQSHEQLRALSVYLQSVREEERTRIAREVHDELGQALTCCKLDLSWIASKLPRELKPLVEKTRSLTSHIDSTIQTVRRISAELRPGVLDHLGLVAALEWQANEFQNRTGIKCDVHANLRESLLDQDLNTTLFRIFQETLTNVIRHAGATQVTVELKQQDSRIKLEVEDNGRGISRTEISNGKSMGLLGMKERAALLGGIFKIGRLSRGMGTRVSVSIPLHRQSNLQERDNEDSLSRRSYRSSPRAETNHSR
ncbi:MAG TPA: histidine kinase [Candidatus Limnocylindrales bacterium]|nr:histidine kinase [Candidatus Limnocylindrales bacterium]